MVRAVRRWELIVVAALALAVAAGPSPAAAHEEVPGVRTVVDSVEPRLPPGVTFEVVVSAADQIVVTNQTEEDLVVPGADGEPFLVIGPDGVLANFRSPTWHRSINPDEGGALPPEADAAAPPRFVRVSAEPSWGWFDHRLHATPVRTAPVVDPGARAVLDEWAISFRLGDTEHVARGRRIYERPEGAFRARIESTPDELQAVVLGGLVPAIGVSRLDPEVEVELLDEAGAVFARMGSSGVSVNQASALWQLTDAVRTRGAPAEDLFGPDAEPTFVPYEAGGQLIWLETRAVFPSEEPPADVSPDEATVVRSWQIPVRIDGRADELRGVTEWVPEGVATPVVGEAAPASGSGDGVPSWLSPVVVLAMAVAMALVVGRSRLRGSRRKDR